MKTIELTRKSPIGGECSATYSVTIRKPMTIREFMKTWFEENPNELHSDIYFEDHYVGEYAWRKLCELNDRYADVIIYDASACGGWGRMDFYFYDVL